MAIAVAAIAIFFATNVKAQTTPPSAWRLGIGVEDGLPRRYVVTHPCRAVTIVIVRLTLTNFRSCGPKVKEKAYA